MLSCSGLYNSKTHIEPTKPVICFIRSKLSRTVLWHRRLKGTVKNMKQESTSFCLSHSDKVNHTMKCSSYCVDVGVFQNRIVVELLYLFPTHISR